MDTSIYEPQVPDPTGLSHFGPRPRLGTAHDAPLLPVTPVSAQEAMISSGVNGISWHIFLVNFVGFTNHWILMEYHGTKSKQLLGNQTWLAGKSP